MRAVRSLGIARLLPISLPSTCRALAANSERLLKKAASAAFFFLRKWRWVVAGSIVRCVLLVALVTVIYGAGLSGGFIFDDYPNLLADPSWQLQVMDLEGLRKAL